MNKVRFSRLELFMAALIASALAAVISGCGLITETALSHDEYLVICVTGYKQGAVIAYIVPHNYALPPDMLPKCETAAP